ncbi:imelysin family protein [Sedimentitalea todarodis]|uniref:Imelysin family protein n=1 Tax=Sedimentitalea todarodis TaxID=1631240 RepID=A0ABU3V9S0_9RHOB|nr:imelysin family protein [Sedimentitalea todarodis]MDU9002916.1 imelysin family protein [Sedimentitalea todarodis]
MRLALAFALLAAPVLAGTNEAIEAHILPGAAAFATTSADLASVANADCRAEALRAPWNATFDAWLGISHLTFGPIEENGRTLAIAFWPDTRGLVQKTVARLIADQDPVVDEPEGFAQVSVAGRGLFALERLLYDPALADYGEDDYNCALARAIATDLARMGAAIDTEWRQDHAARLKTAGEAHNQTYLSPDEAAQTLYTALMTGLEFTADQRLGRPMGSFDRPRPNRAEAHRSGRSLRNVTLSLTALQDFAHALSDTPTPHTDVAFAEALQAAQRPGPILADVSTVQGRIRVEAVQQRVRAIRDAVEQEIGSALGVSAGFNSADGD